MSNSLAKKVFAVGSAVALAVSVFPVAAIAAAHPAGTNLKSSDGTVWMVTPEGTRRPYTSAGAFLSYGFNSWSKVVDANADDLALPSGSFIPPQDGKIICSDRGTDKGTCYLITGGQKAAFVSEAVFKGLGFSFSRATYGDVSWMTSASNIENTTAAHRPGVLVLDAGTVKLIGTTGYLGIPSESTFTGWGYQWADVVPANAADKAMMQTGVMAPYVMGQLSPTSLAGGTNPTTPTTGTVTASLASDNPATAVLAGGSSYNTVSKYTLTNSSSTPVNLTQVTLTRGGIIQDSSVSGVAVFDSTGRRHGNFGTFGTAKSTIGFSSDPIMVPANGSTTISVKLNLVAGVTSGTVAVGIAQASDLVMSGATAGGFFPLWGNTHSIVSGTNVIGSSTVQVQTQGGGTSASPAQIDLGVTNLPIQKFRISETSGQEDIRFSSITLFNNGTAADGDYTNITLKDQANTVLSTVARSTSGKVQFSMATPFVIPRGTSRDFTVFIDVPGVANSASRTINFTVQNDYDVELYGSQTASGILPTAGGTNSFPVGDGVDANNAVNTGEVSNHVQFKTGSVTVSKATDSPSGKMAPGTTQATLASFDVKAFGEDIELQRLSFVITDDGSTQIAANSRSLSGTVKVNDELGGTLYSTNATTGTLYHSTGVTVNNFVITGTNTANAATATQVTLNTYKTVKAGTTAKLNFVVDVPSTATSIDSYAVRMTGFYARRVSTNNYITDSSVVTGNVRQVDTTSLRVYSNSAYNPTNLVKGGSGLKIGSFNIQAGAAEDVTLTSLGLSICTNTNANAGSVLCTGAAVPTGVSNIQLKTVSGTTETAFGTPISSTSAGTTETFSGNAVVKASATMEVNVYADVSNAFNPNTVGTDLLAGKLTVIASVGQSSQTNITDSTGATGQTVSMSTNGVLRVQSDASGTPVQQIVRASQTAVPLMTMRVSEASNTEDLVVTKVYFAARNGAGNYNNLALFDGATQVGTSTGVVSGEIRFSGLSLNIAKGSSPKVLTLKGDSTASGTQVVGQQTLFAPTYYEYRGSSSGTLVRVSGGVIAASANSANQTVNDGSQFQVGDKVAVDLNNDGAISGNPETNTDAGYEITAVSGNVITLSGAVNTTATGGRVIALDNGSTGASVSNRMNFASNAMINHNVEPVVAVEAAPSNPANGTSGQSIATFKITAGGTRDLTVHALQFKFTGTFVSAGDAQASCTDGGAGSADGGIFDVQVWQNNQSQAGTLFEGTSDVTAGAATNCFASGDVASFRFNNPVTISAGQTTDFVVKANTSQTRANLSTSGTISYGIQLDGVAGIGQLVGGGASAVTANRLGGVFWDYTDVNGKYGSTSTVTAGVTPDFSDANAATGEVMDVTDYYPVNGPVFNY